MTEVKENNFIRRFAKNSGVSIEDLDSTIKSQPEDDQKIIVDLNDLEPKIEESTDPLVRPEYTKKKRIPLHQNPFLRTVAALVLVCGVLLAAMALFNSNFSFGKSEDPKDDEVAERPEADLSAVSQTPVHFSPPAQASASQPSQGKRPPTVIKNPSVQKAATPKIQASSLSSSSYQPETPPVVIRRRPSIPQDYNLPVRRQFSAPTPARLPNRSSSSTSGTKDSTQEEKSARERMLDAIAASTYSSQGGSQPGGVNAAGTQSSASQNVSYLPSEQAILDDIPQQRLARSSKAKGQLLSAIAFSTDNPEFVNGQPVEVEITDSESSGLEPGTRIVAEIKLPEKSGNNKTKSEMRLIPKSIVKCDLEYAIEDSAISLTGKNGKPLIASAGNGFGRALENIGKALASGLGAAGGSLINIPAGSGTGLVSAVSQAFFGQNNQQEQKIRVLILKELTPIQITVRKPIGIPAQCGSASVNQAEDSVAIQPEEEVPPRQELSSQKLAFRNFAGGVIIEESVSNLYVQDLYN